MSIDTDVVIVGAGAAGLAAAIELQSTNLTFIILEARDRVGGRAHTDQKTFTSTPIDLGASWIHSYGPDNVVYDYHQSFNINQNKNETGGTRLCLDYDGQSFSNETMFRARLVCSRIYEILESYTYNKKHIEDQSIEQVINQNTKA